MCIVHRARVCAAAATSAQPANGTKCNMADKMYHSVESRPRQVLTEASTDGAIDSRGLRRAIWRRWRLHVPVAAIYRRGLIFGCRGFGLDATGNAPSSKVAVASGVCAFWDARVPVLVLCVCESLSTDELAPVDPC